MAEGNAERNLKRMRCLGAALEAVFTRRYKRARRRASLYIRKGGVRR
jgi:hypothetical protein